MPPQNSSNIFHRTRKKILKFMPIPRIPFVARAILSRESNAGCIIKTNFQFYCRDRITDTTLLLRSNSQALSSIFIGFSFRFPDQISRSYWWTTRGWHGTHQLGHSRFFGLMSSCPLSCKQRFQKCRVGPSSDSDRLEWLSSGFLAYGAKDPVRRQRREKVG